MGAGRMNEDTHDNMKLPCEGGQAEEVHALWFHLREVQEQEKLIAGDTGQNSDYLWVEIVLGKELKEIPGCWESSLSVW